jgi:hypothetical protein
MKTFLMSGLLAGSLLAGAALLQAQDQTLTGVVSNTHCGLKHNAPAADAAGCVKSCVGRGASYALVVGDKIYTLEGGKPELEKLAGLKASVTGHVDGANVHVSKVAAAQ